MVETASSALQLSSPTVPSVDVGGVDPSGEGSNLDAFGYTVDARVQTVTLDAYIAARGDFGD